MPQQLIERGEDGWWQYPGAPEFMGEIMLTRTWTSTTKYS